MKFSINIPAYKSKFLGKTLESVLSQTYIDYEVIIVDDHSPEDIFSIVSQFNDKRIRYYRNEVNKGAINVVDNWNICLSYSNGDYVICMGDDDMLSPDALEKYAYYINKYPDVDVFHSRVMMIDELGQPIRTLQEREEYESALSLLRRRLEGTYQFIGDFCYKKEPLIKAGGFYKLPLAWGSDDISALRAAERAGIVNINTPTFLYRVNGESISSVGDVKIKLSAFQKHKQWCLEFLKRYKCSTKKDIEDKEICLNIIDSKFETFMIGELMACEISSIGTLLDRCRIAWNNNISVCTTLSIGLKKYIKKIRGKV